MGRLLSRMVFNIYTAELHQIENSNPMVFQYADDFIILFYNRDFEIAAQNLQTKTLIFKRYCNSLNLSFNPSKSHTMYFAKKKKTAQRDQFKYQWLYRKTATEINIYWKSVNHLPDGQGSLRKNRP